MKTERQRENTKKMNYLKADKEHVPERPRIKSSEDGPKFLNFEYIMRIYRDMR